MTRVPFYHPLLIYREVRHAFLVQHMTHRPPHANKGVSCRIAERVHALQQLIDAPAMVPHCMQLLFVQGQR
jgi:hypothetical protein